MHIHVYITYIYIPSKREKHIALCLPKHTGISMCVCVHMYLYGRIVSANKINNIHRGSLNNDIKLNAALWFTMQSLK